MLRQQNTPIFLSWHCWDVPAVNALFQEFQALVDLAGIPQFCFTVKRQSPVFGSLQAFGNGFQTMTMEFLGVGSAFSHWIDGTPHVWSIADTSERHFAQQGPTRECLLVLQCLMFE